MTADCSQDWLNDYVRQFMKSPSWAGPIKSFIDDNSGIFDVAAPDENKLEYTEVHDCFKELVDSLLAAHLLEVDITPEAFASAYDSLARADPEFGSITEQLVSVADFLVFKKMMMGRNLSQKPEDSQARSISSQCGDAEVPVDQRRLRRSGASEDLGDLEVASGTEQSAAEKPKSEQSLEVSKELGLQISSLPTPARGPSVKRADRIAAIVQKAIKPESPPDALERAALVRSALTQLLVTTRR
ncbi:unnamed protein product [Polarella glacialis]|uniref:Cilia- and flagella-associated protein 36 n=1 Tax=Polarella glacialis TaxID=89957 RepID=A0A813DKQ4_POLGL|nr:unnamed protein product [Polarella glacialis]CAE8724394.1 unnamed protein product [Polarella glacialis]